MKVAVFGSWPGSDKSGEWTFFKTFEDFKAACRQLGGALAERGHTLIVESDREGVADKYVVEAYVERAAKGISTTPLVELAFPRGEKHPFEELAGTYGWFEYHTLPVPDTSKQWSSSHLTSLRHSEAVLTVAGKTGTYTAGSAAIVANRPLAPVACFGGASARLLQDLKDFQENAFSSHAKALNGPWGPIALEATLKLLSGPTATVTKALFVSHAHQDEPLANAVVELVRAYFDVSSDAIRCTSVPGYDLAPGADVSRELRAEIEGAEFVLALVTPRGVKSTYVLFELGAAWGLRRTAIPLLAHGFSADDLPGPLMERNPVDLTDAAQCYSLLQALTGSRLMRPKNEKQAIIQGRIETVVAAAKLQAGS